MRGLYSFDVGEVCELLAQRALRDTCTTGARAIVAWAAALCPFLVSRFLDVHVHWHWRATRSAACMAADAGIACSADAYWARGMARLVLAPLALDDPRLAGDCPFAAAAMLEEWSAINAPTAFLM